MARVATSAPFVSVPAAASPAATTPTTTPGRLAVVVPVTVSFLAGAVTAVLLTGHVQTAVPGLSFPSVQPLVQIAGLQEVPIIGLVVTVGSHGLIFSFTAVRISFLSLTALPSLFPAVLIEPDTWGAHSLGVAHLP